MAGVPTNFQAISNVLPTYNFVDIASGTGYVNFYAGTTVDKMALSNFTYYSDTIYASTTDDDYDVLLNRPMDLKGLGIVNVPVYIDRNGNPSTTAHVTVKLRKWDGSTETEIVSNDSTTLLNASTAAYYMQAVDLVIPLTHFKIGETLRLTIQIVFDRGIMYYGHDPQNRSTGWDTTGAVPSRLTFQCPVRLNL